MKYLAGVRGQYNLRKLESTKIDQKNSGEDRKIVKEEEEKNGNGVGNVSQRIVVKKIGSDELVDGWPKWLVDNIPSEVLAALVPKSADSYDKVAKVGCLFIIFVALACSCFVLIM